MYYESTKHDRPQISASIQVFEHLRLAGLTGKALKTLMTFGTTMFSVNSQVAYVVELMPLGSYIGPESELDV